MEPATDPLNQKNGFFPPGHPFRFSGGKSRKKPAQIKRIGGGSLDSRNIYRNRQRSRKLSQFPAPFSLAPENFPLPVGRRTAARSAGTVSLPFPSDEAQHLGGFCRGMEACAARPKGAGRPKPDRFSPPAVRTFLPH
ncbi:MAG: hypothetical protein BAA03_14630 [Caldibacillus debilis]|nr:MAG: hypothetical protein BAA03_14630 [Caldibacillus debilis]